MNNRRLLIGGKHKLTRISATMDVAGFGRNNNSHFGFSAVITDELGVTGGSISPNPLPNGITVTQCYFYGFKNGGMRLSPSSISSVTINNIKLGNRQSNQEVYSYLKANKNKRIPIIFHFD